MTIPDTFVPPAFLIGGFGGAQTAAWFLATGSLLALALCLLLTAVFLWADDRVRRA